VQTLVVGGRTIAGGRRRLRSAPLPRTRVSWDYYESAAAERVISATELRAADSEPPTLPLPRVA
jgi:hypothetical protein